MDKPVIFDSCVWLSALMPDDSNHAKARKLFAQTKGLILVPREVVIEVYTALVRNKQPEDALQFVADVTAMGGQAKQYDQLEVFEQVCREIGEYSAKLSFVDVMLVGYSKEVEVKTFDKLLLKNLQS